MKEEAILWGINCLKIVCVQTCNLDLLSWVLREVKSETEVSVQEVEWGRTLGPRSGEAETSGMREGLSVVLPKWVLRPGPPSETWVPGSSPLAKSGHHMLPPTPTAPSPARERPPLPASAVSAAVPKDGLSWACSVGQTALCAGTLFQSPASVFTASRVVLKAKQTGFCYSSPQKLPLGLPVTSPAPHVAHEARPAEPSLLVSVLHVPSTGSFTAFSSALRPAPSLLHACAFWIPSFLAENSCSPPETQDRGALGSALTPRP